MNIWFTGLSGSGKSTLANKLKQIYPEYVLLDGDILRQGLCSDIGFSKEDRQENMRRLIELCKLFVDNGNKVITAFISPYEINRKQAKLQIPDLKIVYCNSSLKKCEERDIKGLYKKARAGEIKEFTGITSVYELPEECDLELDTEKDSIEDCILKLRRMIEARPKYSIIYGRFVTWHRGHQYLIKQVYEKEGYPVKILIRDTNEKPYALERQKIINHWLYDNNIKGFAEICEDIHGVFWGRGVGYKCQEIEVPEDIKQISGTKIREQNANKNN